MQNSVVEMHHLIKKIILLIFKNMVKVCIIVLARKSLYFLPPSRLFAYLHFRVLIKERENQLYF